MPIVVALLATAEGTAIVTENVFDNRFGFVAELNRMGADIRHEGRHAVVRGVERLSGAPVRALDVRAGAALVLAGLAADGETVVFDPYHVDRGYCDFAGKLPRLGRQGGAGPRIGIRRESRAVTGSPAILAGLGGSMSTDTAIDPAEQNQQVLDAIELIRPALQSDGGDIVFREVDADGVVHVTLVGACGTCPISMQTLKAGVERIIMDRVPGVTGVTDDSEE